jgi:LmbE family N-acetylglucosaminyl deacetylase
MPWIYLSPHFDDVAFSCGGLLWDQAQQGKRVSIWTVCAGEVPPGELSPFARELHNRWELGENAPFTRREEDRISAQRLGTSYRYFSVPDCIYRRDPQTGDFMYASEASLNGALQPGDIQVIRNLQAELSQSLPLEAIVVCPLGLGNHVDHQLTRRVAEGLKRDLWYYADFPYVLHDLLSSEKLTGAGLISQIFPISSAGLTAWMDSISAHASQISTFWENDHAMRMAVADYMNSNGGVRMWRKPAN